MLCNRVRYRGKTVWLWTGFTWEDVFALPCRDTQHQYQKFLVADCNVVVDGPFKQELADRCAEIARRYKLSAREEEVLLLLAQHKTVGIIERELVIANGTAKAHVRHIYQKLDIHTRQELFDLLDMEPRD